MKFKHLFTITALSTLVGVGAFANTNYASIKSSSALAISSNHNSEPNSNALSKVLYVDLSDSNYWDTANAKFAIYDIDTESFISDSVTSSPYMTKHSTVEHVYKMNVNLSLKKFIVTRNDPTQETPSWTVWNQTVDISLSGSNNGAVVKDTETSGKNNAEQCRFDEVEDGMYIKGSFNDWTAKSDYKMAWNEEAEQYEFPNLGVSYGAKFKINEYNKLRSKTWYGASILQSAEGQAKSANQLGADSDGNILAKVPGSYSLYLCDSATKLYVPEIAEEYYLEVGGTQYELVENPGASTKELVTTDKIELSKDDAINLVVNSQTISAPAKKVGNNSLITTADGTVSLFNITGKIYVGIENKDYTVFGSGITLGDKGISFDDEYIKLVKNPVAQNDEWMIEGIHLTDSDYIKFVNTSGEGLEHATVFSAKAIKDGGLKDSFKIDEQGYLVYTGEDSVTIDLYIDFTDSKDEVYIQESGSGTADAVEYAIVFNDTMTYTCDSSGQTEIEVLAAVWEMQADAFGDLDPAAKAILQYATSGSSNPNLAAFAAKYDYIYGKYGSEEPESSIKNFASRQVSSINNVIKYKNSNAMIYIIVAGGIATVVTLAGLIISKKRKVTK